VARKALLDTGFVVALVNASDPDHTACLDVWRDLRAQLFTVEGVLVESSHSLRKARGGPAAANRLVLESGAQLVPISVERAERVAALMERYEDVPMDFVDALLVTVAEDHDVQTVLTLDRRGFGAYRIRGRRRFEILP
jgi:predicted nucleic acid-binding protein